MDNTASKDRFIQTRIQSAISIMGRNVSNAIGILQIASNLNMSYSYFRKEFKKQTGIFPNQYFQNLKIKSAKNLLFSTNLSVKEICFQLGYSSPETKESASTMAGPLLETSGLNQLT